MSNRYVLAPQAVEDLVQIWRHIKEQSNVTVADRVELTIRGRIVFLSRNPGVGHWRRDLTSENVKCFSVYEYLVVYKPETNRYRSFLFFMDAAMSREF